MVFRKVLILIGLVVGILLIVTTVIYRRQHSAVGAWGRNTVPAGNITIFLDSDGTGIVGIDNYGYGAKGKYTPVAPIVIHVFWLQKADQVTLYRISDKSSDHAGIFALCKLTSDGEKMDLRASDPPLELMVGRAHRRRE